MEEVHCGNRRYTCNYFIPSIRIHCHQADRAYFSFRNWRNLIRSQPKIPQVWAQDSCELVARMARSPSSRQVSGAMKGNRHCWPVPHLSHSRSSCLAFRNAVLHSAQSWNGAEGGIFATTDVYSMLMV